MRILILVILLLCSGLRASAGQLESAEAFKSNTVNPYLTLDKIRVWEKSPEFRNKLIQSQNQKIFWNGIITKSEQHGGYIVLNIKIGGDSITAVCENSVRNMEYDRTGYKIAFKGSPVLDQNGKMYFVDIWSIILLSRPKIAVNATDNNSSSIGSPKNYKFIYSWIKMHNPHYSSDKIQKLTDSIISCSQKYGLDPRLVISLLTVESAMDTGAVSHSGAMGLGQLMPLTAKDLGVEPRDSAENIKGACSYLSSMMKNNANSPDKVALALASYNAGPGNVRRYGGIPPFSETKNYVLFIKFLYNEICSQTK